MYHTLQLLKPFGIAGFTASPLSEEFPYSRLLWEFLFRGSAANPTIAQSRFNYHASGILKLTAIPPVKSSFLTWASTP